MSSMMKRRFSIRMQPRHRLIAAGAVNRFGDSIDTLAISWLMYRETGSPVLMGLLFAASFVPNLLFSPIAGVFADRNRKVRISVICDILRGMSTLFLALCALIGWLPVWLPFVVILFNATCETFASPAKTSLFPLVVPQEDLLRTQGLNTSALSMSDLAGTASAGIILATLGMPGAIVTDSLTFFVSALLTFGLRHLEPAPNPVAGNASVRGEFLEGLRILTADKRLLIMSLLGAFINFFLTPFNVLLPVFADRISPLGASTLSVFGVAITIGIVLGGLGVARFHKSISFGWSVGGGLLIMATGYGLAAIVGLVLPQGYPATALVTVCLFALGFSVPFIGAPSQAYAMKVVPPAARGRYFSILGMFALIGTPLGGILSGIAARSIEPAVLFLCVAGGILLIGVAYLIGDTVVKRRTGGEESLSGNTEKPETTERLAVENR